MVKRHTTILFLLALIGNSLAALPPHQPSTGGCDEACCETARLTGPAATIAGICCIVECPQPAETPPLTLDNPVPPSAQALPLTSLSAPEFTAYLQQTNFPSAPTRYLHGSSSRYLDCCSFLL